MTPTDLDEIKQHCQAETARTRASLLEQAAYICHYFPQYKPTEVLNDMPGEDFDQLFAMSQILRFDQQTDISLAIGSCLDKHAAKELKNRAKARTRYKQKLYS